MNTEIENTRSFVTDAPHFKHSCNENVRLLHRIPGLGLNDWIEVIGDPDGGGYEWVIRADNGKIIQHSDSGYGCTLIAMRDGIAAYECSVG